MAIPPFGAETKKRKFFTTEKKRNKETSYF
nr:MAG TPA: hypothetical protein [Caudoviricetes sp.]